MWNFSQPHSIPNQIQKQFSLDLKLKRDFLVFSSQFRRLVLRRRRRCCSSSLESLWILANAASFVFGNFGRNTVAFITIIVIIRAIVSALLTIFVCRATITQNRIHYQHICNKTFKTCSFALRLNPCIYLYFECDIHSQPHFVQSFTLSARTQRTSSIRLVIHWELHWAASF